MKHEEQVRKITQNLLHDLPEEIDLEVVSFIFYTLIVAYEIGEAETAAVAGTAFEAAEKFRAKKAHKTTLN